VLIGILVMALLAPDHAGSAPSGRSDIPSTTTGVSRSGAQP
jgi:hypothetical protein